MLLLVKIALLDGDVEGVAVAVAVHDSRLVAQVGVIIASTAMAVKQKSLMWMLATLAGLVAIGFGGYVFLGMN